MSTLYEVLVNYKGLGIYTREHTVITQTQVLTESSSIGVGLNFC